jgi:hypothetical protein
MRVFRFVIVAMKRFAFIVTLIVMSCNAHLTIINLYLNAIMHRLLYSIYLTKYLTNDVRYDDPHLLREPA